MDNWDHFSDSDEDLLQESPHVTDEVHTSHHVQIQRYSSRHDHFNMARFVLCWTGLTCNNSSLTCVLCGIWYSFLGVFGIVNIILPYAWLYPGDTGMNGLLTLYQMAGVSCVLLFLMWLFTLLFFRWHHPQRRCHTSKYRLPEHINTAPIICVFLLTCGLFGCITTALLHDLVLGCLLFDPPVRCYLHPYVVCLASIMSLIMFSFLCLNCVCYRSCVRRNAGHVC